LIIGCRNLGAHRRVTLKYQVYASSQATNGATGRTMKPPGKRAGKLVYVGTGDNYTAPPGVCTDPGETGCAPPAAGRP
jgi:polyvinyl alcohol dehydrogenase (cytochrome)